MIKSVKKVMFVFLLLTSLLTIVACSGTKKPAETAVPEIKATEAPATEITATEVPPTETLKTTNSSKEIILATTTSTENSGLLAYILPDFTKKTGIEVKVVSVGTGAAMQLGRDGEADVLLVHDTAAEIVFVEEKHSAKRSDVMYNDFVLVGNVEKSKEIVEKFSTDIVLALKNIADNKLDFVSRGDDSGTHRMELRLFKEAGFEKPEGDWYKSVGKGMGDTIMMANELKAFTLSDRATYLTMKDKVELEIVVQKDKKLLNQYGVLVVDPSKNTKINNAGAIAFEEWILSKETQELINTFGVEKFGESLFIANAK